MNEDFRMYEELLEVSRKNLEEARKKMTEQKGYDLSAIVVNPQNDEPLTLGDKPMSVCDAIITSFKMPTGQDEKLSDDDINFRRKLIQKLRKATDKANIPLKSRAVQAIKEQARKYYVPGIAMQVYDVFDGEYSDSTLEDI